MEEQTQEDLASKDNLTCERTKRKKIHEWHKDNHSPPPRCRSVCSQSPSHGCFEKTPPGFIAEHIMLYTIPPLSIWASCCSSVLSQFLVDSSLLAGNGDWETEKTLMLCKPCSAAAKTLMCYQHCSTHKTKTQHHVGSFKGNLLHPNQTQYTVVQYVRKQISVTLSSALILRIKQYSIEKNVIFFFSLSISVCFNKQPEVHGS